MSHEQNPITSSSLLPLTLATMIAVVAGCANNRTANQSTTDDGNISMMVGSKLLRDPEIDRFRIDVDSIDGVVYLRGEVRSEQQRDEAERLAKATEGVERVVNELVVDSQPYTAEAAFDDAWIAVMVKGKLARDPEVKAHEIDVDAMRGVVTLSGSVADERARREAESLAATVDGVSLVVNDLEIES